jgi:hypothetical protein
MMATATHSEHYNAHGAVLFMAFELTVWPSGSRD